MAMNIHALKNLLAKMEAQEEAERSSNYGAAGSFNNNHGNSNGYGNNNGYGNHPFSGSKINNGAQRGNGAINNSGTFNGHGNGGNISGDFNASTRNYY
ncbi:hypothetical protein Lal_00013295 [Lupinus albus]|uniref:Uncharacterized protein n=1 Tax=Lupinus albus TaxID=3870 RepID=A0A6A5P0H0_LUPAL|nr:hypothetical protein Lalb_Chr18g0058811 [Lupinus albus]KAF1890700.1 hypothetical protein Lal_00013295 [Lupinus albus]